MESWEYDLQKQIQEKPNVIVVKTKSKNNSFLYFLTWFLLFVFCLLFAFKKYQKFRTWIFDHFKIDKVQRIVDEKNESWIEKLKKVEEEIKKNSRKLNLLGIVQNENFSSLDQGKKFLYLNHDWKLNRMPNNLEIHKEDEQFIKDNIADQ